MTSTDQQAVATPEATLNRVAFIDLGTNSCRLCIVEYDKDGRMNILTRLKNMVRLGEGAFDTKTLQPAAMDRTAACLVEFAGIARSYQVAETVAVATASLRVATNREDFVARVRREAGIDLKVISGEEEARLIRHGIFSGLPGNKRSYLFIDIGGGSTELSISNRASIFCLESLNVGCVFVNEAVKPTKTGRVTEARFEQMMTLVKAKVQHALKTFSRHTFDAAIASSGTALALLTLAQAQEGGKPVKETPEGGVLTRKAVQTVAKKLCAMTLEQRRALSGLSPARAEVIVAGAAVLLALMTEFGLKRVFVTERNLQDGQRFDYLNRQTDSATGSTVNLRADQVKLFAKRWHFEKTHCRQIKRLAVQLFESAADLTLCKHDAHMRELLGYAARLHDVGISVSYDEHYRHSGYLVRFSHLLGFTDEEIEIMARLVHRHSRPGCELPDYLTGSTVSTAEDVAAVSLFVAEVLDKTHRSLVKKAVWTRRGSRLVLSVTLAAPAPIEMSGKDKIVKHVKRVLGRTPIMEFVEPAA